MALVRKILHILRRKQLFLPLGIAAGAAVIVAVSLFAFPGERFTPPPEFSAARRDAAETAGRIVELTTKTNELVRTIDVSADGATTTDGARFIAKEARGYNTEAYANAFQLSQHLQRLTESLALLPPGGHQRVAYEAIAVELSLVSEFISYTHNLDVLLKDIEGVAGESSGRKALTDKLAAVNRNVQTINRLNREFLSKMNRFGRDF